MRLDFLFQLTDVDQSRIGVTGASGGGTQTMIIAAIDDRVTASMPCVMVSTAMQGGCTCENAPLLRIDQGNIDIAAAFAPKPLALTAADDWTIQLESKGFPDLLSLYETLGEPGNLKGVFRTEFKHNYNLVNRTEMCTISLTIISSWGSKSRLLKDITSHSPEKRPLFGRRVPCSAQW